MTQFSSGFLAFLVYGGIILAGLGGLTLLTLLARDLKQKALW